MRLTEYVPIILILGILFGESIAFALLRLFASALAPVSVSLFLGIAIILWIIKVSRPVAKEKESK